MNKFEIALNVAKRLKAEIQVFRIQEGGYFQTNLK